MLSCDWLINLRVPCKYSWWKLHLKKSSFRRKIFQDVRYLKGSGLLSMYELTITYIHRRTGKILLGGLNIICPNETCWSRMHKMILSWRHCHCIVLFAYFLSMLITAILLSRSCPIVDLKNVLMRRRALKDLSAEHEVAGIVARMEVTLYRTGKMSWRPFWCMVFSVMAAFFLWHGSPQS